MFFLVGPKWPENGDGGKLNIRPSYWTLLTGRCVAVVLPASAPTSAVNTSGRWNLHFWLASCLSVPLPTYADPQPAEMTTVIPQGRWWQRTEEHESFWTLAPPALSIRTTDALVVKRQMLFAALGPELREAVSTTSAASVG